MATGRVCLYCGLECRRQETGVTWSSSRVEVRVLGGAWTPVPEVPPCTAESQVNQYYRFLPGRSSA
jgi:ribosomal protein L37AE/L43A